MTSYLPRSSPGSVDRLVRENDMARENEPLGRRDEKGAFMIRNNVQRLGEHVTAALLVRFTP
jgi:hypothetical protein